MLYFKKRKQNLNLWKPQLWIGYSMLQHVAVVVGYDFLIHDMIKISPFPIDIEGLSQVLYVATSAHTWPKIL